MIGRTDAGGAPRNRIAGGVASAWPLLVVLAAFAAFLIRLNHSMAFRVGDGSEYYAMFLAWRDTLRPFMTPAAWASYADFYQAHRVGYLVAPELLKATFPSLMLGTTEDFNHFWFYGLIPALAARLIAKFASPSPHSMFLWFHWLLAAFPLTLSWKYFRWPGLLATTAVIFLSPMLWFVDKVHTEFFTACLVLTSVIFFRVGRQLLSSLCLALASTQNISMLAVAGIVVLIDLARRGRHPAYSLGDALCLVAIAFASFIHPLYYFFRLGGLTPQFIAGGASVGANLGTFYLWFVDPDLGLIPNWPLVIGIVLAAVAATAYRRRAGATDPRERSNHSAAWIVYVAAYLAINLFAQSSTENLNSGGTPGLARYAIWYIPLFFPAFLVAFDWGLSGIGKSPTPMAAAGAEGRSRRWSDRKTILPPAVLTVLVAAGAWYSYDFFRPALTEVGAFRPSWSSMLIQRLLPTIYDPPQEVFKERYGGVGENDVLRVARAVIGPDCRKILVLDGPERSIVLGGGGCVFSATKLNDVLRTIADATQGPFPRYVRLTEQQAEAARLGVPSNEWLGVAGDGENRTMLAEGWGSGEEWGTWSAGAKASIWMPCTNDRAKSPAATAVELALRPFITANHKSIRTRFFIDGAMDHEETFSLPNDVGERIVTVKVPPSSCRDGLLKLDIEIIKPMSPIDLRLSDDARVLGVGLSRFRIVTDPVRDRAEGATVVP